MSRLCGRSRNPGRRCSHANSSRRDLSGHAPRSRFCVEVRRFSVEKLRRILGGEGTPLRLLRYRRPVGRAGAIGLAARPSARDHQVPPAIFGAERPPRPTPYILTAEHIRQLVDAASRSGYRTLRRATYSTLFSLLACTGLRVSEAIRLRFYDLTPDGLVIRGTKFRKSRLVPLHETAQAGLERYLQERRPYAPFNDHVFVSLRRKPLLAHDVDTAFCTAVKQAGLPLGPRGARPTPHSLRHSFAVRALQTCPDGRDAITKHMLSLSTYLGHSTVANTYWYLEAVPDL